MTSTEYERVVMILNRIAVALETLASDVKPPVLAELRVASPTAKDVIPAGVVGIPAKSLLVEIAERVCDAKETRLAPLMTPEIGKAISDQLKQEAPIGQSKILEAPAATPPVAAEVAALDKAIRDRVIGSLLPTGSPVAHSPEAQQLEAEFVAQEAAHALLGDELHAAIWGVDLKATATPDVATKVRDAAVKILGGVEAWAPLRESLGVKAGSLPTGEQMRRLAAALVTKSLEADKGDAWES